MKLVERYVYDVTRRLPDKQRDDVSRELSTEIYDMVEARAGGKRPTKKHIHDVLAELGSPSKLANSYREAPRYLIGPDYYEPYVSLLKTLLLIILPILIFTVWMVESLSANHSVWSMLVKLLGVALQASLHVFFWTTASFWFVQKMADGQRHDHNWTPEDLPEMPAKQSISRGETTAAIGWTILGVVGLSFQIPAVYRVVNGGSSPQFFAPEMWPGWTLGLIGALVAALLVELWKFHVRGWTRPTLIMTTIVNVITIGFVAGLLYFVDPIVSPAFSQFVAESLNQSDAATAIALGVQAFAYLIIALCVWEVAEAIYKYQKGGKS